MEANDEKEAVLIASNDRDRSNDDIIDERDDCWDVFKEGDPDFENAIKDREETFDRAGWYDIRFIKRS